MCVCGGGIKTHSSHLSVCWNVSWWTLHKCWLEYFPVNSSSQSSKEVQQESLSHQKEPLFHWPAAVQKILFCSLGGKEDSCLAYKYNRYIQFSERNKKDENEMRMCLAHYYYCKSFKYLDWGQDSSQLWERLIKGNMGKNWFQKLHGKLAMLILLIAWERLCTFISLLLPCWFFSALIHLSENCLVSFAF